MPTVAIVGAGPAGLVIGYMLQRAGIAFDLLERNQPAEMARQPKAGLVEYRTVQLLRAADIADSVLEFGTENHRCEFRTPQGSALLEYSSLTGGRPHYIYPQHELVERLCTALTSNGAQIQFGHTVESVSPEPDGVTLRGSRADGSAFKQSYAMVVGCEGSRSPVAAAMTARRVSEEHLPVRWLAVIGEAPPLVGHTVYAAHPAGFAGQMRRGPDQTRYYLEVAATDTPADWPAGRIRAELGLRLIAPGQLDVVPFGQPTVMDLRERVVEPLQQGRLFLAGDAAHLVTPAGGKGMNLAIQDAVELAGGLIDRFADGGDGTRLASYSDLRMADIWRTQAFSHWFLRILLVSLRDGSEPGPAGAAGFSRGMRNGWVHALQKDSLLARWFAHAYAGVDPD